MGATMDDKHKLVGREVPKLSAEELEKQKIAKVISLMSKQVLGQLNKDKVPPTPENFKVYFENQLEKKPSHEKKKLNELLLLESAVDGTHTAALEKDIQDAFVYIKSMTESIASVYSGLNRMRKVTAEKLKEVKQNPSATALVSYEDNLLKTAELLEKELKQLKNKYSDTAELIKDFNQNTIYDKKYGSYNKKYLLRAIQSTIKSVESFEHDNTLLAIRIKPQIIAKIKHQNDKEMIKMNVSKLLLKRARRSDIVAHYENGIFMIILKHASLSQAKIAISRIEDMIDSANFIVNAEDISVELEFGLAKISKEHTKEEIIIEAIDNFS
jgi:diguanylate cyclase (GGDEF)-like protein